MSRAHSPVLFYADRRSQMEADPHKPLRQDVRLLGELLGDTLREHEGARLLETVERVRAVAKTSRARADRDFQALASELGQLPVDAAIPLARAFTHFLNLANVAEQHHRIRRRRAYLRDPGSRPQRGSPEETFARLVARGVSPDALHDAICALQIELVLTAHPTEVSRRTLIHKHNRVAALLAEGDSTDLTVPERERGARGAPARDPPPWVTDEVRHQRLTPLDEVKGGLIVFEQSLWHALPRFLRSVDRALIAATGRALAARHLAGALRVVDRRRSRRQSRTSRPTSPRRAPARAVGRAELYLKEMVALRDELSMTDATAALRARVGDAENPTASSCARCGRD